jgi:hypothetical protein
VILGGPTGQALGCEEFKAAGQVVPIGSDSSDA